MRHEWGGMHARRDEHRKAHARHPDAKQHAKAGGAGGQGEDHEGEQAAHPFAFWLHTGVVNNTVHLTSKHLVYHGLG